VTCVSTKLTVRAGVLLRLDVERAWALAVDWPRQREWILATSTSGGHGLGATVTGWTGIGPVGFTDPMEITQWLPPARCTLTHLGKVVRGEGVFEVLPRGDAAEFRWTERIELPLPAVIGRPVAAAVVAPLTRLGLAWSLRRFARLAADASTR
jgi:hypothetical protein